MSDNDTADKINAAMEDPVPSMHSVPVTTVKLMRGIYDKETDVWHDEAEVRELTGEDEEYLATVEAKKDITYSEYMTSMLSRVVVRVGDIRLTPSKGKTVIDKLILGDRDLLYLTSVKATYGDTRTVNVVCSSCKTMNDVQLDLDEDFPVRLPEFDVRKGIEVETSKGTISLRLPNGEDTVIAQKQSKNDAELNTVMLSRCAVWAEGEAPEDPLRWARGLNIGDRKKLVNALLKVDIGPRMGEVDTHCASCGENMPILLDWVSLLFS
jgi:hypothetical protein